MSAILKKSMRDSLKQKRAVLYERHPDAGEKAANHFFTFFNFPPQTIFGLYWPMASEIDPRPLLYRLSSMSYICTLPRVTPEGLVFHQWEPALELEKGTFGLQEPPPTSPVLEPDIVIIPLLGFDRRGHRIGYGKGHYDYYLQSHQGTFIGLAFAGQEVDRVPHETHDICLGYIVTEEGVIPCSSPQSPQTAKVSQD